jgi:hypothetical protein
MAATSDKELICTLTNTNTNSTLTSQLATKDKVIEALHSQLHNINTNNAQAPAPAHAYCQVSASDKKTLLLDAWSASLQPPQQYQLS